jgi:NitT/TauT family transport system ATP-binding protein
VPSYIDIAEVSLTYPGQEGQDDADGTLALQNLTLGIGKGDAVAVVGPSGCGKSTLLKLVSGLHRQSQGQAAVAGRAITRPLSIVGRAFQNPTLLPWRTALDNVLLPLEIVEPQASTFQRERSRHEAAARELLNTVGLAQAASKYPWQLSGGMQQRASIARALAFDADLLLMDEPFGALDEIVRDHLNEQLLELWARTNKTICFVTHSIPEAVYLSTRIVVMSPRPGRVTDIIESTLPRERPLDIRETPEFLAIAARVRDGLRAGHSYED